MAVPDFRSLMRPAVKALADGGEIPLLESRARIAASKGLTSEDIREMLPSGRQPTFTTRANWAIAYLGHAGLTERTWRRVYRWSMPP